MTASADLTDFDRTTALTPVAAGAFSAHFTDSWSGLGGVLGGYVAAHAVRAVEAVDPHRNVRTVSVTFLRPSRPGDARLGVVTVREGRSLAVHDVEISQGDRHVALARVTTSAPAPEALTWRTDRLELPPPPEQCEPISPPEGARHFEQAEAVLDAAWRLFSGRPRARVAGWVRQREPRPLDAAWLTMILDWFPPAAFARAMPPTGGVSVDYTVHLHRTLPSGATPWLAGIFRADTAEGGLALEHGTIATADGSVIAESFHTRIA